MAPAFTSGIPGVCRLPFGTRSGASRAGSRRRIDSPAMAGISAKRFARQSRRMQPDYRRGGLSGGDGTVRGAFFASGTVPAVFRALRPARFSGTPLPGRKWPDCCANC